MGDIWTIGQLKELIRMAEVLGYQDDIDKFSAMLKAQEKKAK